MKPLKGENLKKAQKYVRAARPLEGLDLDEIFPWYAYLKYDMLKIKRNDIE
jgi:hypothetical protein